MKDLKITVIFPNIRFPLFSIFFQKSSLFIGFSEGELDVGTHTLEFEYELPEALPSSFEDDGSAVGMLGTLVIPSEGFM